MITAAEARSITKQALKTKGQHAKQGVNERNIMIKNTKVFEIKSYDEDGDIHTSFAAVCLRKTLVDVLKGTNIPLESIVSVNVTPPMNVLDAMEWIRIKNAGCRLRFGGLIK